MLLPTQENFRCWNGTGLTFFGTSLHPKARLYKYVWQIWTPDTVLEGDEFFKSGPRYCTAEFMDVQQRLIDADASGFVYNRQFPRRDSGLPIDPLHPRWVNCAWAPSWEDDGDPIWNGHK